MDPKTLLQQFFTENTLLHLATISADGQPWICNVYFVTDEESNIYWTSARKRRHSKEIQANPLTAGTIVHDSKSKQAVQVAGRAYEVSLDDAERIDKLYSAKFGDKDRLTEIKANLPDGRAYWVLKPHTIELWDEVNFPDNPKQSIPLE